MSKHEAISATEARIPLSKLTLSALNPRQTVQEQEIVELAQSIWAAGLIQSIAGLADANGGAEIVAGGRRLRALQYLAQLHPDLADTRPELASPVVMLAPDAKTAEDWASLENVVRRDLHPAEEIRAFGKMEKQGSAPSEIARAFAVTEKQVYRRLALAKLPTQVIDALAEGEINLSMAACFTIADDENHSLKVLEQVRGRAMSDYQLKKLLKPDSVEGSDRRAVFVGETAYKAAGGKTGGDLFSEVTLFDSPEILDELFIEKLDEAAKDIEEAEGWKWVQPITDTYVCSYSMGLEKYGRVYPVEGVLSEEQSERYEELAELADHEVLDDDGLAELASLQTVLDGEFSTEQKVHAGAYVYVDRTGTLNVCAGMIKPEDKQAAIDAGVLRKSAYDNDTSAAPKSPISQKLADDLRCVARGARQHALLRDPDLIIDLLAYQLSHYIPRSNPFAFYVNGVPNWPSTEDSGYELDSRLTTAASRDMNDSKDLAASFRAFRKKGGDHIKAELARFLATQYQGVDAKLAALIDKETQPNIREVWTPTADNFFGRVSGQYLGELWRSLLDLPEDHPTNTSFAKLKKAEKAAKLAQLFSDAQMRTALNITEDQEAKIATWLPEGMEY